MGQAEIQKTYMEQALKLAKLAATQGEVPVGAVLVNNRTDSVISGAHNEVEKRKFAGAHAELLAIEQGAQVLGNWRLEETTLYVTLEPCPMCASLAVLSRVGQIVFGCSDPRMGATGSLFDLAQHPLLPHKISVVGGIMESECRDILQDFFQGLRK